LPRSPHGKQTYSFTLSLTSTLDGLGGQRHAPAAVPPEMTRHPLYRRLSGPQGRSGRVWKFSSPLGYASQTSHLYRLRYPSPQGEAVSVQAYYRSTGFPNFGVPTFLDNRHKEVVGCQSCAPAAFTPRKYSCYSYLLEVESTPGPATNETKCKVPECLCP